jgi:hypothetical protein
MSDKPFQEHRKFTTVHNYVFDLLMPILSPNAFKVFMYITRHTRGMVDSNGERVKFARLGYSSIKKGTGISGNITLATALKELRHFDLILTYEGKEYEQNSYAINEEHEGKSEIDLRKLKSDFDAVRKSETDLPGKSETDRILKKERRKEIKTKKTEKRAAANDAPPARPTEHKDEQPVTASVKADPVPARHPFVEIYRETFHRYPAGAQTAQLEKSVGAAADSSKWREVCEAWLMAGYKPVNLAGMLDWYHKGIPQHRSNVPARASPKNEYAHAPPARDEEAIARTRAAFDAGQIPGYVPEILKRKNA